MDNNQPPIQVSRIERVMRAAAAADANNQPPLNHQTGQVPRIERVMQAAADILDNGRVVGEISLLNASLHAEANASNTSGEHSLMRFEIPTEDSLLERRAHPGERVFVMACTSSDSAFSGSSAADSENVLLQFQIRRWRQIRPWYPPGYVPFPTPPRWRRRTVVEESRKKHPLQHSYFINFICTYYLFFSSFVFCISLVSR